MDRIKWNKETKTFSNVKKVYAVFYGTGLGATDDIKLRTYNSIEAATAAFDLANKLHYDLSLFYDKSKRDQFVKAAHDEIKYNDPDRDYNYPEPFSGDAFNDVKRLLNK